MAKIDLHKFRDDLRKKPPVGTNGPPIGIRAKDLDENFAKVTLVNGAGSPPLYEVEYTKDGTRIKRILPNGTNRGDLLYWTGDKWDVLAAASGANLRVLTLQNGNLAWTATEDCP